MHSLGIWIAPRIFMASKGNSMDERDLRILEELKADAWLSYIALSERVNLSASATQRRVERLKDKGILLGATARIAPDAETDRIAIFVLAELCDDNIRTVTRFAEQVVQSAAVVEAHYVAGEADIVLCIMVADLDAYATFVENVLNENPLLRRFKTLISLRKLK